MGMCEKTIKQLQIRHLHTYVQSRLNQRSVPGLYNVSYQMYIRSIKAVELLSNGIKLSSCMVAA